MKKVKNTTQTSIHVLNQVSESFNEKKIRPNTLIIGLNGSLNLYIEKKITEKIFVETLYDEENRFSILVL